MGEYPSDNWCFSCDCKHVLLALKGGEVQWLCFEKLGELVRLLSVFILTCFIMNITPAIRFLLGLIKKHD